MIGIIAVLLNLLGITVIGIKGIVFENGNCLTFDAEITINVKMNKVGIYLGLTTTVLKIHSRISLSLEGKENKDILYIENIIRDLNRRFSKERVVINVHKLNLEDSSGIKTFILTSHISLIYNVL